MPGGKCVGFAEVIGEDCLVGPSANNEAEIRQINIEPDSKLALPEHLVDLFNRSAKDLNEIEQEHLKILLTDFQDVFAKHDLDLGCLSPIKHRIDTKDANPYSTKCVERHLDFNTRRRSI